MRNLDTGLDLNQLRLMSLRDSVMAEVMNTEQFIDYLYNLMSNEMKLHTTIVLTAACSVMSLDNGWN